MRVGSRRDDAGTDLRMEIAMPAQQLEPNVPQNFITAYNATIETVGLLLDDWKRF